MNFNDVETARIAYAKKIKKAIVISSTVFILAVVIAVASEGGGALFASIFFGFFFACIIYIVCCFIFNKERMAYRNAYKKYFVEQNLRRIFTDISYSHDSGVSRALLDSTGMINTGDVFSSNDYTTGKYKDVDFLQSDVTIQVEQTDSDGDTTYQTIFKGRWMTFEFPKKFAYRIEVVQKWFPAKRVPKTGTNGKKFEKVEVESPTFHKKFKIYADDGFETFYVLDPALIDHIESLSSNYTGKLLLCFVDNKLHVGLHDNKDAFEPPSALKKIDENAEFEKISKDIKMITDFVDYLKLDNKIFGNN